VSRRYDISSEIFSAESIALAARISAERESRDRSDGIYWARSVSPDRINPGRDERARTRLILACLSISDARLERTVATAAR